MRQLLISVALIVVTSCAHSHAFFPRVELENSSTNENPGAPISGEDCVAMLFGSPLGTVNARTAIDHAVGRGHASNVTDVHVSEFDRGFWIAGEHCVHVDARLP